MALKDWKKKKYGLYEKRTSWIQVYQDSKETVVYRRHKKYEISWVVRSNKFDEKWFKTKTQALKYAKSYMRKH